ncbi:MAG: tRNA preQ1(34) S-adenosylmethionine ribosyltransferase-isomerase QueA [Deltaproteobacteria bacterium]|nr:tRNA preQ1(34) S-adenosylmethionine ribosyltransferase-isomerase QueA [Deltaproteobacteria bacterium]
MNFEGSIKVPPELIAQYPSKERGSSRLLVVSRSRGILFDGTFNEGLKNFIEADDILIFNDTKVINARLEVKTERGSSIDLLVIGPFHGVEWRGILKNLKRHKEGEKFLLRDTEILLKKKELFFAYFTSTKDISDLIAQDGKPPIPLYIRKGRAVDIDSKRYQTVYAKKPGSIAAPTAGLHFSDESFEIIRKKNAKVAFLTLHVGPSSIAPYMKVCPEWFSIPQETVFLLKGQRKLLYAVGTTSVRALETFALTSQTEAETNLIIEPGYNFLLVDGFFTNFHLPDSSHIKIVSAYLGTEKVIESYTYAIKNLFKFFSYGDCMMCMP